METCSGEQRVCEVHDGEPNHIPWRVPGGRRDRLSVRCGGPLSCRPREVRTCREYIKTPLDRCHVFGRYHFFFSSRRRHTRLQGDWSSDVCSSDLPGGGFSCPSATERRPIH